MGIRLRSKGRTDRAAEIMAAKDALIQLLVACFVHMILLDKTSLLDCMTLLLLFWSACKEIRLDGVCSILSLQRYR